MLHSIPIVILPHIFAYIHNSSGYLRWGMQQTTCKCLTLSYIYRSSSASVHGKSLNMIKHRRSNIRYNVWLIVCVFLEAYLMYFFPSKKGMCIKHRHKKCHTIRHDRLKTTWCLFFIHISQDKTLPSAGFFFFVRNAHKYKKTWR